MSGKFPQKIVGWTCYDDPDHEELFKIGEVVSWEDIIEIEEMIADELREKGYMFSGFYHQGGEYGCPLFDNGKWYGVSYRRWGAIMAMAHPETIGGVKDHAYVNWAWTPPCNEVYPNPDDYRPTESPFKPVTKQLLNEIFEYDSWPLWQKVYYHILNFLGKFELAWYNHVMMPIWAWKEERQKNAVHDKHGEDAEP